MENIEKLKESLNIVHDYLYVQILGKAGEDALFELNNAITIVENLTIHGVVKSLPQDNFCQVCNLPTDGVKCYSKRCPV